MIYIYKEEKLKHTSTVGNDKTIVLSPSLYWHRIAQIPTSNIVKAKKIALHMFTTRPDTYNDISLFKEEQGYSVYAYDLKAIRNYLAKERIKANKIFFAQQLSFEKALKITDQRVLFKFNSKAMECDKDCLNIEESDPIASASIEIDKTESKNYFHIEKDQAKSRVLLNIAASIFALFVLLSVAEGYLKVDMLQTTQDTFNTKNKSMYEINALIKKYEKLDKKSQDMKKKIQELLSKSNQTHIKYENGEVKK